MVPDGNEQQQGVLDRRNGAKTADGVLTTNTGRVWLGVADWRFGYADQGTGYEDVLPGNR